MLSIVNQIFRKPFLTQKRCGLFEGINFFGQVHVYWGQQVKKRAPNQGLMITFSWAPRGDQAGSRRDRKMKRDFPTDSLKLSREILRLWICSIRTPDRYRSHLR